MATMITCTLNGSFIDIDEAIDIKDSGSAAALDFPCTECNQPVRLTGLVATQLRTLSIFCATPTAPKVMLLASVLVPAAAPLRLA